MSRWLLWFVGIVGVLLTIGGCAEPECRMPELVEGRPGEPVVLPTQHHIIGRSVQNRPIMCQIFGNGPEVVLIMATIHGSEPAGTPLVRKLAHYLEDNKYLLRGRTVVLMPLANPDGLALQTRGNANGVDLNRNFSAHNRINNATNGHSPLCEPESQVIYDVIHKHKPDRIVSIHQPLACIDYDGPAAGLAGQMARYCTLPVRKLGGRPGSLGSYAGMTLGIPIITFEMLESDSQLTAETLWQRYGKALLAAIVYPDDL